MQDSDLAWLMYHNLDNHIPIVNTLETNFGDFGGIGDYAILAAERRSVNY